MKKILSSKNNPHQNHKTIGIERTISDFVCLYCKSKTRCDNTTVGKFVHHIPQIYGRRGDIIYHGTLLSTCHQILMNHVFYSRMHLMSIITSKAYDMSAFASWNDSKLHGQMYSFWDFYGPIWHDRFVLTYDGGRILVLHRTPLWYCQTLPRCTVNHYQS